MHYLKGITWLISISNHNQPMVKKSTACQVVRTCFGCATAIQGFVFNQIWIFRLDLVSKLISNWQLISQTQNGPLYVQSWHKYFWVLYYLCQNISSHVQGASIGYYYNRCQRFDPYWFHKEKSKIYQTYKMASQCLLS